MIWDEAGETVGLGAEQLSWGFLMMEDIGNYTVSVVDIC